MVIEMSAALRPFLEWRQNLSKISECEQKFGEWVFLNASAVFLSEKTGELLTFNLREFDVDADTVELMLLRISLQWGFDYRVLYNSNGFLKLIIYHADRLKSVLAEAPFCVMGVQLNYICPLEVDYFLDEIKSRWESTGAIPHEIGIALGYPLDDVFGYMGLLPLSCKGVCGWRVYGCMHESKRRSCAFQDARCKALVFLAQTAREYRIW